jgi:hypothetical protein
MTRAQQGDAAGVRFIWPVVDVGYQWSSDHELSRMSEGSAAIKSAPRGPWLLDPLSAGDQPGRYTRPLKRRHDLNVEFARLPMGHDEAELEVLASFASTHGLLGLEAMLVRNVAPGRSDSILYAAEHVSTWRQAIREMHLLVELITAYKGDDIEQLRGYVRWFGRGRGVRLDYTWPGDEQTSQLVILKDVPTTSEVQRRQLDAWSTSTHDTDRYAEPVKHYLYREVNRLLRKHLSPRLPENGGLVLVPDSLFGAMVVMLAEQLSGDWQMNLCPSCGRLFVPRCRRDQKTCSAACRKRLSRRGRRGHDAQQPLQEQWRDPGAAGQSLRPSTASPSPRRRHTTA